MSGDSWIRVDMIESAAKMKCLKIFRIGHLEHSDCDCYSVAPQQSAANNESELADRVREIFAG